jgi:hypothetical protein
MKIAFGGKSSRFFEQFSQAVEHLNAMLDRNKSPVTWSFFDRPDGKCPTLALARQADLE